jgi:hypothetical protein
MRVGHKAGIWRADPLTTIGVAKLLEIIRAVSAVLRGESVGLRVFVTAGALPIR